jgi:hypothetical protein
MRTILMAAFFSAGLGLVGTTGVSATPTSELPLTRSQKADHPRFDKIAKVKQTGATSTTHSNPPNKPSLIAKKKQKKPDR